MNKRCKKCNKKIKSVLPIMCKCENYYCNLHKMSFDHECSFDHVKEYQNILEKRNERVVADKFEYISNIS